MSDFFQKTIKEINQGLKKRSFSALDIAESFIKEIEKNNDFIFSLLSFNREEVISQAKEIDKEIARKKDIPILSGIPSAIKDNILMKGGKTTAGSKMLENYIAPYDATVIKKIKKAGSIIIGKANMDEFAMGSSTEHSAYGVTRNPLNTDLVPGGSSGGSAAAVAANFSCFALGSDTGGSIRQPASFCGLVGLKPTYGAVSRYGLIAMASSLDQIGPLTKNVEDAKIVFKAISGKDKMDSTSADYTFKDSDKDVKNFRIGIPEEYFKKGIDKNVEEKIEEAIVAAEKEGFKIKRISLPYTEYALPVYYIISPSEISANLARYDGLRYGLSKEGKDLSERYFNSRKDGLGVEVKRRISLGSYTLSAGYYDAYYKKAQQARSLIINDFKEAFQEVDLILAPTSPTLPFKIGEKAKDPLAMYLSDIFTAGVNIAGLPAISLPCGKVGNLSVGMQVIGSYFKESDIFKAAEYFEKIWKK